MSRAPLTRQVLAYLRERAGETKPSKIARVYLGGADRLREADAGDTMPLGAKITTTRAGDRYLIVPQGTRASELQEACAVLVAGEAIDDLLGHRPRSRYFSLRRAVARELLKDVRP